MSHVQEEYTNNELHIKKFKPDSLRDSCIVVFVASKGSGKSTTMIEFMWHKRHLPAGAVFSGTEEANHFFSKMVPSMYCFSKLDVDKLKEIYHYQEVKIQKYKQSAEDIARAKARYGNPNMDDTELERLDFWAVWKRDPHIFIIIEDMMADKKVFKSALMRDLFMNGRHYKMFVMITVQYLIDLPRELRSNVDYWVLFQENSKKNLENLYFHVANKSKSTTVFYRMMEKCTTNFGSVVVNSRCNTGKISDSFFWYRAKEVHEPFRVGSLRYWHFAEKNYQEPDKRHKDLIDRFEQRIAKRDRDRRQHATKGNEGTAAKRARSRVPHAHDATDTEGDAALRRVCRNDENDGDFMHPYSASHFDVIRRERGGGAKFNVVMEEV